MGPLGENPRRVPLALTEPSPGKWAGVVTFPNGEEFRTKEYDSIADPYPEAQAEADRRYPHSRLIVA